MLGARVSTSHRVQSHTVHDASRFYRFTVTCSSSATQEGVCQLQGFAGADKRKEAESSRGHTVGETRNGPAIFFFYTNVNVLIVTV